MNRIHLTHFGVLKAESDGRQLRNSRAWAQDPDPRPIIHNVASSQHHATRVLRPAVRRGYLEHGPGRADRLAAPSPNGTSSSTETGQDTPGAADSSIGPSTERGSDEFVEVSWDEALDLVAAELARVYRDHGSRAVYGESYGWSSAGRFNHGKSQVHRFLNSLGGYVYGVGDYSFGTSKFILPHVVGLDSPQIVAQATSFASVEKHTELFVSFGGFSRKNSAISSGGVGHHKTRDMIVRARANGCEFVEITPIADDGYPEAEAEWIAPRPGTDTALMLAIAFVLDEEGLVDREFLDRFTTGYDRLIAYVRGESSAGGDPANRTLTGGPAADLGGSGGSADAVPKTPEWAEGITTVPAATIRDLARRMARSRTIINVTWSMQRQHHGEQPIWMGIALAAMLGQIGLPGGGFQHGYGSSGQAGHPRRLASPPFVPQGTNLEPRHIPVARIADMLLSPGSTIELDGRTLELPHIELVYWVGGNPFHHQQDLAKLHSAFQRPATVIVHEQFWTATARHADIVLPATMTIERDDYGAGRGDPMFFPMPALTEPAGEARDDYVIFAELEQRLRAHYPESFDMPFSFSEGRTTMEWLRHLYDEWREKLAAHSAAGRHGTEGKHSTVGKRSAEMPSFDEFWASEHIEIPALDDEQVLFGAFREDPAANPLSTPSGLIELFSETVDGFGYEECPGHPVWLEPREWLGNPDREFPLHLIANQPASRLHSQLDVGATSLASKVSGREPVRMHPADAAARGLASGDVVRVFNARGACLAGLVVSDVLREGVAQLSTGAWYDPAPSDPSFCRHGNPNVLCTDLPSSRLSHGTTGQHALVDVEKWEGELPPLSVTSPPPFVRS